jgi:hypothetical protein
MMGQDWTDEQEMLVRNKVIGWANEIAEMANVGISAEEVQARTLAKYKQLENTFGAQLVRKILRDLNGVVDRMNQN